MITDNIRGIRKENIDISLKSLMNFLKRNIRVSNPLFKFLEKRLLHSIRVLLRQLLLFSVKKAIKKQRRLLKKRKRVVRNSIEKKYKSVK